MFQPLTFLLWLPSKLAEAKVRVLEAKQTLEDCITAQEFSRAAELKDSITELENRRNQIIQEIEASSQPSDKEARAEKVRNDSGSSADVFLLLQHNYRFFLADGKVSMSFLCPFSPRMTQRLS